MTQVIYNDVTINRCHTRTFRQECVYDETETDLLYHRFTIMVVGYVHGTLPSATVGVTSTLNSSDATLNQVYFRAKLLEPRRRFIMAVGDRTLLDCGPRNANANGTSTGNVHTGDLNSGPKPRYVNVTAITGTSMFQIEFEIEICKLECDNPRNQTGVLSNRWSFRDSIDADFYTTRTITGRLRVADVNLNPQAFRGLVIPPLQNNFKRESIETTTSPNGLELEYTVIDREVYAAAPRPATSWRATHRVITDDGVTIQEEASISVVGDRLANKIELIELVMSIANQVLELTNPEVRMEQAHIIDYLNENRIEMMAHTRRFPDKKVKTFQWQGTQLGKPYKADDYRRDESKVPAIFGTASATGLFVSYLQSPCDPNHAIPQFTLKGEAPDQVDKRSKGDTEVTTNKGELPPDEVTQQNYSSEAAKNIYTHYEVETRHSTRYNTVQLPISKSAEGANLGGSITKYDASVFVNLSRQQTWRDVTIVAQRLGAWPQLPSFTDSYVKSLPSMKVVPIGDYTIEAKAPTLTADGRTYRYEIELHYRVGYSRPLGRNEAIPIGKIPWDSSTSADNRIPLDIYDANLDP